MADFVFNVAKGAVRYYASLPGATDSLIAVPLESSGIAADGTLADYSTLEAILAGTTNEQTSMGRKALNAVAVNQDNVNDRVDCDFDDPTWTNAAGNAVAKVIVCYVPSSGAADSSIIPLTAHDFAISPDGSTIIAQVATAGFYRAQGA